MPSEIRKAVVRNGGLLRYFSNWVRFSFKPLWYLLQSIPILKVQLNRFYIAYSIAKFHQYIPRIPNFTLKHNYPTMHTLYDESRTTYSRILKRADKFDADAFDIDKVAALFDRDTFVPETNRNISVLLSYYAQWFSHMFLNTNKDDTYAANQPLGINMSNMYGSTPQIESTVRSYTAGLLKSTHVGGAEFPEIIDDPRNPGAKLFNMPIMRANLFPGFAAIHIIWFRRHQHVARKLKEQYDYMDDEEIFQKTKLIIAATLLRVTMHDYVARSLQSSHIKIQLDPQVKQSRMWKMFGPGYYPPCNSIQVEFNFLYRWHQFIPDTIKTVKQLPVINKDTKYDIEEYECEELCFPAPGKRLGAEWNAVQHITSTPDGLERVLFSAASQRAGKLGLMNTNKWLVKHVVKPGLQKARDYKMATYNDYREHFEFGRVKDFDEITSDKVLQRKLKDVYGEVDNIEYYPGIFAEDKDLGGVHGPLLASMGTAMTFMAIHASRLFEAGIIDKNALTERGMELFDEINMFEDLTKRHATQLKNACIRFTVPEDAPVSSGPSPKLVKITRATRVESRPHAD